MQVCALDPSGRLSISLDTDHCLLELEAGRLVTSSPRHVRDTVGVRSSTLDTRRGRHGGHGDTRSTVCLPQVHSSQWQLLQWRQENVFFLS